MRSGGDHFNYLPENKLTKLSNFVQFIHILMFCLEDSGAGPPLAMPLTEPSGLVLKLVVKQVATCYYERAPWTCLTTSFSTRSDGSVRIIV